MRIRASLARFVVVAALALTVGFVCQPSAQAASSHKKTTKTVAKTAPVKFAGPNYSSIVVDAETGRVLHEVNADVVSYPASLTKMMTLYLLFDALERGEVRMTTPMPVSAHAVAQAPSKLNLVRGRAITVDQAIDAIVTLSANDVAVVIAEYLGGTEEKFAEKMTAAAHAMGMIHTHFHNASGLPDAEQLSTARDMAILGKHLIHDHPEYYPLFSRMDFSYGGRSIHTHNHVLENYAGADGIKTGYTTASGYNLVSSAVRDGHRIIAVVFGGATAQSRDRHMEDLLDQGFAMLNGQTETLVASKRIEEFQAMNAAEAMRPASEPDAQASAGDREDSYTPPASIAAIIQSTELPAAPAVADAAPVPAPKLAPLPATNPRPAQTLVASTEEPEAQAATSPMTTPVTRASLPVRPAMALPAAPMGTWGIQIGAYSNEGIADAQAAAAADALKPEFGGASPFVQTTVIGGKKLYRAQVLGLDHTDLLRACGLVTVQAKTACKAVAPESNGRRVAAQ